MVPSEGKIPAIDTVSQNRLNIIKNSKFDVSVELVVGFFYPN